MDNTNCVAGTQYPVRPPGGVLTSTPPVTHKRKMEPGSVALTVRQRQVLEIIRDFVRIAGIAPTRSELRKELGCTSQGTVDGHLHSLAAKSWVQIHPGLERAILLRREGAPLYEPHVLGATRTATKLRGETPPEPEWIDDQCLWRVFGQVPALCVWIRDNAMDRAGLLDGGIVALGQKLDAQGRMTIVDGDIVAARGREEVIFRRVRGMDATTFELRPESTSRRHKALQCDAGTDDVEILGVMIGVMRGIPGRGK